MNNADVIIVGAGPVGLLTAIELTLGGARVVVLERLAEPSQAMKAMGFGTIGGEALQRRGLTAGMAAAEARNAEVMRQFTQQTGADLKARWSKYSGHFAGLLIRKDEAEPQRRAHQVPQPDLEALLAARAEALGIVVRRQCEVTGFDAGDDGVTVDIAAPDGPQRMTCDWLVACDGGRSTIRKMAGFAFPGTAPTSTFYQVVADIDHPEALLPPGWRRTEGGVFSYGPIPGRLFMLDFSGPSKDREAPVTRDEVERVLRQVSGQDVRVTALRSASRWGDNTRLADTYRRGRVLLAGDAAHVHSPFGGQGLNLGLVDAANLGWKLAAVVRGDLPDTLLDTYTAERRPVAETVLANTLAQVAILRPDPQSGAMRDLLARLMTFDDANGYIRGMMSGTATRYELSGDADIVGRLLGDMAVGEGVSLYDLMQDGSGVLLDATGGAATRMAAGIPRLRCVSVTDGPSLLIRPDACVAWAGEGAEGLEDALRHWFRM